MIELLAEQLAEHAIATAAAEIAAAVDGIFADPRRGFVLLAREGEVSVGVAYVSFVWTLEHGGKSCWLEELYVRPARRNEGLGAAMLDAVLARAAAEGAVAIDLEVAVEHMRAANLYRRRSFAPLGRERFGRRL